jgi:hypothetical protein
MLGQQTVWQACHCRVKWMTAFTIQIAHRLATCLRLLLGWHCQDREGDLESPFNFEGLGQLIIIIIIKLPN